METYSKSGLSKAASQISRARSRVKSGKPGIRNADLVKFNATNDEKTLGATIEETKDTDGSQGAEKVEPSVVKTSLTKASKVSTIT